MKPLGLIDGKIIDLSENIVPMEDRGHQFGDGVYEYTKVYNGRCFALKPHIDRLFRSLRELRIPAVYTYEDFVDFHDLLIKESGITDGGVYVQITRGVYPRAHAFPDAIVPRLTMSIRPGGLSPEVKQNGSRVIFIPDERWLRCDIKSLNLLGNVMGKQAAKEAGCFEAVMIRDGLVTEGTSSNFFIIKDGVLWTYPATNLILKGVTRTFVISEIAPVLGLPVVEKAFTPDFAMGAHEAFVTGTTTEIMPIVAIDGKPVADGGVGTLTRKIQQEYYKLIEKACGRN